MPRTPPTKAELTEMAQVHLYYEVAMLLGAGAEQDHRRNQRPDMMNLDRADPVRIA
jgi:hypothetical protein